MTKTMSLPVAMVLLASLTACDYIDQRDFHKERSARLYRTAMEDYRAGRLPQAVEALQKVCRDDPSNASARFQLACLLQDSEKDYFGAACAYREYLMQRGDSEKSVLARDRLAVCERELATALAAKYRLNDVAEQSSRNAALQEEIKLAAARQTKLQKDLAAAMQRITHLVQETDRLKGLLANTESETTVRTTDVEEALSLLQEENAETTERKTDVAEAQALLKTEDQESDKPSVDRDTAKVTALLDEESKTSELLTQPPDAKAKRDASRRATEEAAAKRSAEEAAARAKRPATYVVSDGDTLYKLAVRFYGRASAWSEIRDANKAVISTDGRIKTGQKLVLP